MGGPGFALGLAQGLQQGQDRMFEAQRLKLEKQLLDARIKGMDLEDQLKQHQLQSLMRKMAFEERAPSQMAGIVGPQGAPLGAGEQGPATPTRKERLGSFLMAAPPDQRDSLYNLMIMMAQPDVAEELHTLRESTKPTELKEVGPGGALVPTRQPFVSPQAEETEVEETTPTTPQAQAPAPTPSPAMDLQAQGTEVLRKIEEVSLHHNAEQDPKKRMAFVDERQQLLNQWRDLQLQANQAIIEQTQTQQTQQPATMAQPSTATPAKPAAPKAARAAAPRQLTPIFVNPKEPKTPDFGDRLESAAASYGQTVYGKPTSFSELLQVDPMAANRVRQEAMVDEPALIQAGKLRALIPEREQELLSPEEANKLGMPYGTTRKEAKGLMVLNPEQRSALASYDTARVIIADIEQYSERVNKAAGGLSGRAAQAMKLWGAWTQSDPDAALLMSKAGELASVARSLGEKGALANQDVARAAALIPQVTDTREVAIRKIRDMKAIIDQGETNYRKSLGVGARAPVRTSQPAAAHSAQAPAISFPPGLTPEQQTLYQKAYEEQRRRTQEQMKR